MRKAHCIYCIMNTVTYQMCPVFPWHACSCMESEAKNRSAHQDYVLPCIQGPFIIKPRRSPAHHAHDLDTTTLTRR